MRIFFSSKYLNFIILNCFFISLFFSGCQSNNNESSDSEKPSLPEEKNRVEVVIIKSQNFSKEIISNGKLTALQKADIYFKSQGVIQAVNFRNGETVEAGEKIACLDKDELQLSLKKAELAFEQAKIDQKDRLLSMGYTEEDLSKVPEEHLKIANIRSGYEQAELALDEARRQLQFACIEAPFPGIVEGIKQKPFEKANISEAFCSLINDEWFLVEFPLLETEIGNVYVGQEVEVIPIAGNKNSVGTINEINPRIDENGLAWLKAKVKNTGSYIEGMNVKVSIKETVPEQLVAPKSAVVLRQNREVLFRYTGGIAYWTYINILDENEDSYSVVAAEGATLNPGDTVIISNNLNLAHESQVEID